MHTPRNRNEPLTVERIEHAPLTMSRLHTLACSHDALTLAAADHDDGGKMPVGSRKVLTEAFGPNPVTLWVKDATRAEGTRPKVPSARPHRGARTNA